MYLSSANDRWERADEFRRPGLERQRGLDRVGDQIRGGEVGEALRRECVMTGPRSSFLPRVDAPESEQGRELISVVERRDLLAAVQDETGQLLRHFPAGPLFGQ